VVNSDAGGNTAMGTHALLSLTTGAFNTASGENTLEFNTIGVCNTASGYDALVSNTMGNSNTASGEGATSGNGNTASGYNATAQAAEIRALRQRQGQYATQAQLSELKQQLQAALRMLQAKDERIARR
jgi:hypothetical protein